MKKISFVLLFCFFASGAFAGDKWSDAEKKIPLKPLQEFQFLAYYFNQGVYNNIYAQNDFLKGQTVGRLYGGNTTTTGEQSSYFEQRLIPFIIYQPKLMDGKAILRMSFEIDWTWGDASYGAGGNFGSALSADQVNLQTQNLELELIPKTGWAVNLGLQRLYDTANNPYRTFFNTMTYTGYRLMYWGTDAVGISVRRDYDTSRWKTGYYQFYENHIQQNDDVAMWEMVYERDITPTWKQGFSAWYVYDRGNGEGGASVLGQGLNSPMNSYNGTFKFNLENTPERPYKADILWLGSFWNRNAEFTLGRWMFSGFAVANLGKVHLKNEKWEKAADILGMSANVRAGYKYGQTAEDIVTLDMVFASGDGDGIKDEKYTGVITGNTYGSPGGIFISHGAYLLFPHGNVVNRYIAAVTDISNMGNGLIGGTFNLHKDIVPHKFSAKVGLAAAMSPYTTEYSGNYMGTELNAKLSFQPKVFMNIELHAAYLALGDFYNSSAVNGVGSYDEPEFKSAKPANPWTAFVVFKWLLF
ncbi:MAG: hypothetical protein DWQ05_14915 [Calditrichaeota bacterium]|nr:MAG: hypothetical protein DWQ05_14915 [Calditrichota bacterium]